MKIFKKLYYVLGIVLVTASAAPSALALVTMQDLMQAQGSVLGTTNYATQTITSASYKTVVITATPISYTTTGWDYTIGWTRLANRIGSVVVNGNLVAARAAQSGSITVHGIGAKSRVKVEFYSSANGKGTLLVRKFFTALDAPVPIVTCQRPTAPAGFHWVLGATCADDRLVADNDSTNITVTAPQADQVLINGTHQSINWTPSGTSMPVSIVIFPVRSCALGKCPLINYAAISLTIASSTPDTGSFDWTVGSLAPIVCPSNAQCTTPLLTDGQYQIDIFRNDGAVGVSGQFSISTTAPTNPPIVISSPAVNDNWVKGTTRTINWTPANSSGSVNIIIVQNYQCTSGYVCPAIAYMPYTIANNVPDTGSFSWNVAQAIPPSFTCPSTNNNVACAITSLPDGQYRITVSRADGSASGYSDSFIIASSSAGSQPVITSVTPAAGPVGTMVTITGSGLGNVHGVYITDSSGNQVIVGSLNGSSNATQFQFSFPSRMNTQNTSSASFACVTYPCTVGTQIAPPGQYNVVAYKDDGTKSNAMTFTVTAASAVTDYTACLPSGVTTSTIVSSDGNVKVTVGQKLASLGASCQGGTLIDSAGKSIVLYSLVGCWGNPPADYLNILNQQNAAIQALQASHTVITLTCNPSGYMLQ